jgi:hypothetical protein
MKLSPSPKTSVFSITDLTVILVFPSLSQQVAVRKNSVSVRGINDPWNFEIL